MNSIFSPPLWYVFCYVAAQHAKRYLLRLYYWGGCSNLFQSLKYFPTEHFLSLFAQESLSREIALPSAIDTTRSQSIFSCAKCHPAMYPKRLDTNGSVIRRYVTRYPHALLSVDILSPLPLPPCQFHLAQNSRL